MSRFLSFFILFFLTISSVIAQNNCDGCPEYSDVATGSGSVCSGETYIMTVANEACEGAIYFNLNVKVTFGGSWQLKGPSGTIIDGGAEGYNGVDGNYEINEDYGPFCESDGTVFTVSSNQGQFGTTTMDISQEGSIIQTVIVKGTFSGGAGSGSGTFTPAPVNSPATITVTTPSGDITQTVNNCEDFSIDVPFNEINYCTTVAVDLPWEIKCDSTNAVISSGIHNVVILPKEPTLAEDIVNISWNNNTCSWDVSTNNDCDILDIGNIFTISPDPSTTVTQDICESGNQIFTIEYLGIANQEFCPSGEAGNFEINAIYTGCGPDEPVITLTDPTCVSDGSAMLGNYDNTLTYSFSPAGPTIDGTGNINGVNADVNYTLTVSNGQCESTADFTIESQYQAPTIVASAGLTTVCTGSPVTLTGNGGVTYSWEDGLNNTVGTAETITVSPTVTTTYTVTGEDINGCTNTDEITIGVTQKINPEFDNVASICAGETLADLPTISNDGITGTWSPAINNTQTTTYTFVPTADQCANEFSLTIEVVQNPDEPAITITDPTCVSDGSAMLGNYDNTLTYSFSPAGPTIDGTGNINGVNADVNYTLTVSNGQCESTADFTIESQYQAPTIEASAGLTTVCTGSPVTLTGNGGVTYSWEDGLNNTVGTAETITVSPTVTTTYTVTGEDINGCTNTDEITIGVTQKIDPEFDNVASICAGETLADLPTISNDGITGTWSPAINNTQTTTYTFVPTADQCANEFSLTIEVVQNPDEPVITLTDPTCVSDGSAMLGNYDNTLTYSFSPAGPTIDGTGNINGANADVNYTLTVSNGQCESTSDFTIEAILEVPTISAQATNPDFCGGNGTINFTFTGVPDGSYIIEYDGGSFMNVQVVNGEASVSTIAGEYNNIFIDNGDCISNLVDISITNPTTNFNGENPFDIEINPFDPIVPAGEQVDLNVYVEPSVQVTQILWFPAEGLSCIDCASPTASPEQTTTYYVEVTNSQGCTAIDSVTVTIDAACGDILVPTHFSPNNDGLNDRLCVLGNCITFLEFEIYDRWGELVFYSTDQKDCWDGTYKGLPAQTGVYVFTMRAGIFNGEEIIKTGTVTLMR